MKSIGSMIRAYFERRRGEFSRWWAAPAKVKDRVRGAAIGAIGAFWIGGLGRLMLGPLPVSISEAAAWGLGGALVGAAAGIAFPKVVSCVLFPFSTFGASS